MLVKAHLDDVNEKLKTLSLARQYTKLSNLSSKSNLEKRRTEEITAWLINSDVLSTDDSSYHFLRESHRYLMSALSRIPAEER